MKTYKFQVNTENGTKNVICTTAAKTPHGIYRAMGKAVAHMLGTDVFECRTKAIWRDGVAKNYSLSGWHSMILDGYADRMVWEAAHNALMG